MVYIFENINTVTNDLLKKFDSLYTEERKIKSGKYCREDDKKKSLIAYILLLYALKKEYGIFEKLYFDYGKNSKPFLKKHKNIYFSISHSGKYVSVAADINNIGVDVEGYIDDYETISRYVFSEDEMKYIENGNSGAKAAKLWTLKESYLKYTGTGIADGLKAYDFAYKPDVFEKYGCKFKCIQKEKYYLSVCSENDMTIKFVKEEDLIKLVR